MLSIEILHDKVHKRIVCSREKNYSIIIYHKVNNIVCKKIPTSSISCIYKKKS